MHAIRRYAEATGLTPGRAVERLRVEAARRLLPESRLPVKRISQRCSFGSEETMRRSFLRLLAATPQDYRARFSSSDMSTNKIPGVRQCAPPILKLCIP